ncbi:hypothetical protein KIH13_09445 [Pseudomonas viridiflava]|nr:hypothetical protein KIH13_09445 [Pseudomonas viridiflava]
MSNTRLLAIQCPQCGHTDFEQPEDVQDDDFVKCVFCGHQIMLCDLKEAAVSQAKEIIMPEAKKEIEKMLKKALKGKFK